MGVDVVGNQLQVVYVFFGVIVIYVGNCDVIDGGVVEVGLYVVYCYIVWFIGIFYCIQVWSGYQVFGQGFVVVVVYFVVDY